MAEAASLADLTYTANTGEEVALAEFVGRPVLIVNTARHCGFAPQFRGLQTLHEEYGPQGLVVLGFPCDQFAHQEPGEDAVIAEECKVNFGVTFPLSTKIDVNGRTPTRCFASSSVQSSVALVRGSSGTSRSSSWSPMASRHALSAAQDPAQPDLAHRATARGRSGAGSWRAHRAAAR